MEEAETLKRLSTLSRVMVATSLAHFTNDALVTLLPAVLPILIEEFSLNYAAAGAILTAFTLLMTSLQAITGYVADRANRIILLFVGLTTLGVGAVLIGFSTDYIQLLTFQCLMGIGASVYHPIGYSLMSDTLKSGKRGKALGLISAAGDIAVPVAFATSGLLVLILGWRNVFTLWGLVAIIIAAIMPLIVTESGKKHLHPTVTSRSTKEIVVTLIPIIIVMSLAGASYRIVSSFTTTYLTNSGLSIESANAVTALMMIIGAVGAIIGGALSDKLGERNTISLTMVMLSLSSAILANIGNGYLLFPIICLMGFALLGVWPSFYAVIASATNLGARAFIYGILFAIAWSFGSPFPYISGACADVFGLKIIYVIVSVLSLVAAFTVYLALKE